MSIDYRPTHVIIMDIDDVRTFVLQSLSSGRDLNIVRRNTRKEGYNEKIKAENVLLCSLKLIDSIFSGLLALYIIESFT